MNNSMNESFDIKRKYPPYRVFCTWEIHYACNYNCSYCHAPKHGNPGVPEAVYSQPQKWIDVWRNLYERYGRWHILISGGEPFIYPSFLDVVSELSRFHGLEFCTNLSWDVEPFIKRVSSEGTKVGTSFHPEFANIDDFVRKVLLLKEHGFKPTVNFVPWPPFLDRMREYKEKIESAGVQFVLQPFIGKYESRDYPQGYTPEERGFFNIFDDDCNLKTLDFKTTEKSDSTKGKLCRMGQNYCFIHPDGGVHRCCRDKSFSLGNLLDGTFSLLEEPASCQADNCNCWRCMLVGKESFWMQHWGERETTERILKTIGDNTGEGGVFSPAPTAAQNSSVDHSGDTMKREEGQGQQDFSEKKVALLQAPVWGVYEPPVGLAQLSGYLKAKGYSVFLLDLNIELYSLRDDKYKTAWAIEQSGFWCNRDNVDKFIADNEERIRSYVLDICRQNPCAVGFSVNVSSLYPSMRVAGMIKEINPKVKVIFGGPHFFVPYDAEGILKDGIVDYIVEGEAEETVADLLDRIFSSQDVSSCPGICFMGEKGVIKTPARKPVDLNSLPFMDLEGFSFNKYDPPGHLGRHISFMGSRGCVQTCVFCGPKAYWKGFRMMSGRRIFDEIKFHLSRFPEIEHVEFLDLLFNGNMAALNEFCSLMIAEPPRNGLRWHVNAIIRPEMTIEVLNDMRKAGCRHITYGIESGSQRVLGLMRKRYRVEDADRVLRLTHEAGIEVTCNFMFGFPGETVEDFEETVDFLRRNAKYITTAYPSRTYCTIEPFSYMQEHMEEFDIVPNAEYPIYWQSHDGSNNYPERMRRCEAFSRAALSSGVSVGSGLQTSVESDKYYNLGFYHRAKGDLESAKEFFQKYLEGDPKNEVVTREMNEVSRILSNSVAFNWDIHLKCNYRCPYCWFYGKWSEVSSKNVYPSFDRLIKTWSGLRSRYGSIKISITGGEPFLYPDFTGLIKELSGMHKIEIITNLSQEVDDFIAKVDKRNVVVNPSFHPLFADIDKFLQKTVALKDAGIMRCVSMVAWPAQIPRIDFYRERFAKSGINLTLQSFFGSYNGMKYPENYNDKERQIIMPQLGQRGGESFQTSAMVTRGRRCAAGVRYGVIHPDGKVLRCGGLNSEDAVVGNIFDDGFILLKDSLPCASEVCPCNEWAFLLEEK